MALSKQYSINWKRSDYITLGKAISKFNKKINELQSEENKLYLPDLINYKDIKENIKTRTELNRVVNSLRRFSKEGAEELYITEAGEQITKWERKELGIMSRTAQKRLTQELKELNEPNKEGISKVQMGSLRQKEIEAQLKNLKKIEEKAGYEFERLKRRIEYLGTSDYTLKMSYVYRKNFMEQLENLKKNSPEFQRVYDYFNDIKNPIEFFNVTQRSDILSDFFLWYQVPENYGSFESKEDVANFIIKEYKLY